MEEENEYKKPCYDSIFSLAKGKPKFYIKFNKNEKIGDIAWRLAIDGKINVNSIYITVDNKMIFWGYDFSFDEPIGKFPELLNAEHFMLPFPFGWKCNHAPFYPPLMYYKTGRKWLPADNWNEGDPINLGPFITWLGYGKGKTSVPNIEDNKYENLIIICYKNKDKIVKKCVNKYAYFESFTHNSNFVDPLTNTELSIDFLFKSINNFKPVIDEEFEKIRLKYFSHYRGVIPQYPIPELIIDTS